MSLLILLEIQVHHDHKAIVIFELVYLRLTYSILISESFVVNVCKSNVCVLCFTVAAGGAIDASVSTSFWP